MRKISFKDMSISEFVSNVRRGMELDGLTSLMRLMQEGAFKMLWDQHHDGQTRAYHSIGQLAEHSIPTNVSFDIVRNRIRKQAITGKIKTESASKGDYDFIVLEHDNEIYLLLDNASANHNLQNVWVYNKDEDVEGFVPQSKYLMSFLLNYKVEINSLAIEKEEQTV